MEKKESAQSKLETKVARQLSMANFPAWEQQFRFHPTRRWRLDFAWPECKVAMEVNGGTFIGGRHSNGPAMHSEYEKLNAAQSDGWIVLQFDTWHVRDEEIVPAMFDALVARGAIKTNGVVVSEATA